RGPSRGASSVICQQDSCPTLLMTTPIKLDPSQLVSDRSSISGCVLSNFSRKLPPDDQKNSAVAMTKENIYNRGMPFNLSGLQIDDKRLIIQGHFLTVARLRDEWYEELGDPELIISALKRCSPRPDLFTFWQQLPDTVPLYSYYHEP